MTTVIDDIRTEMLSEVRAKRESALRYARTGSSREEEYWLGIAGRMTKWIEHLEQQNATRVAPVRPSRVGVNGRIGILLPPTARPSPPTTPTEPDQPVSL